MKFGIRLAIALTMVSLSSVAAYADSIVFTLTASNQDVLSTGGTVTYEATVSAPGTNTAAVFLNGDDFAIGTPLTIDDADFFNNFPLSLAPGGSFTGDLFTVTVPPGSSLGAHSGTFTLLGGSSGSSANALGTVNFTATVGSPAPEPASILLSLIGLAGLATVRARGQFKKNRL